MLTSNSIRSIRSSQVCDYVLLELKEVRRENAHDPKGHYLFRALEMAEEALKE